VTWSPDGMPPLGAKTYQFRRFFGPGRQFFALEESGDLVVTYYSGDNVSYPESCPDVRLTNKTLGGPSDAALRRPRRRPARDAHDGLHHERVSGLR
jgi:hypothetical protein